MKEIDKLSSGLPYKMFDDEIGAIQGRAIDLCQQLEKIPFRDSGPWNLEYAEQLGAGSRKYKLVTL